MSDWNSDSSDDDSQWMPAEEYTVTACPDCGKHVQYLLTGCALAYAKIAGMGYKCYTCGDGTVTCEPCETFGQFDGMIVCACQHGDLRVCMQCCSFTPGERYVQLAHTLKLDIHPVTSYILHTDITKQHADATIATDHNNYHHWCPLKGSKIAKCGMCPGLLCDECHDGQLCHNCRPHLSCGVIGCLEKIQNSTIGRALQSCQHHINTQFCIECNRYFQSRGRKYRCRACNPNNLIECLTCRIGYNGGSVFMPIRMVEPKCLKCDIKNTSIHAIFACSTLNDFENTVAWVQKYIKAPFSHDDAIVICAMTYESMRPDVSKRYKTSLVCRNLREGIYAYDDNKCILSCLVFMRRLPNDIRLKIIEMIKPKQHFLSWFAAPMA